VLGAGRIFAGRPISPNGFADDAHVPLGVVSAKARSTPAMMPVRLCCLIRLMRPAAGRVW
jgi:hypothetical protein